MAHAGVVLLLPLHLRLRLSLGLRLRLRLRGLLSRLLLDCSQVEDGDGDMRRPVLGVRPPHAPDPSVSRERRQGKVPQVPHGVQRLLYTA